MLHKATSIKGLFLSLHFLRHMERKSHNNGTIVFWFGARFKLLYFRKKKKQIEVLHILLNLRLLERKSLGKLFQQCLFISIQPSVSHPLLPQVSKNQLYSFMRVYTDTTLPTGDHPHPPSFQQPLLLCSALLSLALLFSAESQIGGWGVFCGPNKRAKVVRTPLYESVGGEQ